jgi:adenylylsulfate kinase-like enzyme
MMTLVCGLPGSGKSFFAFRLAERLNASLLQTESDNLIFVYYKCLRANIRAKVCVVTAMTAPDRKSRLKALGQCKKHPDLLSSYTGQLAVQ